MSVFADTFYYLAMVNPGDAKHRETLAISKTLREPVVTTAWVLTELADGLATPPAREAFLRLLAAILADPATLIIPASDSLFQRGMDLYRDRPDKEWSLTDCISFVVMADRGLTQALTGDRHFEQAGFIALLK